MNIMEYSWAFETLGILAGAAVVVWQLRSNQRLQKAQYVADVNARLASFNDCMDMLFSLDKSGDFDNLSKAQQERVLDYFTVFEVIEALRRNKVLSTADAAYFFGGRLGDLTSNIGIQKAVLFSDVGEMLAPIFSLHNAVVKQRSKKLPKNDVLAIMGDLMTIDPEIYKARCQKDLV